MGSRAILFDFDGTVVDPRDGLLDSFVHGLAAVGVTVDDKTSLEPLIGPPDYVAEKLARYQTELGFTHVTPDLPDWWTGLRWGTQAQDRIGATIEAMDTLKTKVIPQLPKTPVRKRPNAVG